MRIDTSKTLIIVLCIVIIFLSAGFIRINASYQSRIRSTEINLLFIRRSVRLFHEQTGNYPGSLSELNEYGKKYTKEINWYLTPGEYISKSSKQGTENKDLNGAGGLYYNPETGELKVNLTKPLKSYWKLYIGKRRNEVPADW